MNRMKKQNTRNLETDKRETGEIKKQKRIIQKRKKHTEETNKISGSRCVLTHNATEPRMTKCLRLRVDKTHSIRLSSYISLAGMHKYYTIPDETGNTNITHKQKEYIQ
jgi:hypothetical protein